jgi:nicotinate-nucleotide pyrophosphorylase (carboxylating)
VTLRAHRARIVEPLPQFIFEPLVRAALAEDFGLGGDVTSEATVPAGTRATALIVARHDGVLAGLAPALLAFRLLDPEVDVNPRTSDGGDLVRNQTIAKLEGDARALLGAERTALNLLTHMSGIATATAAYVAAVGDSHCAVCETRKTLPGLRALQKYAVRAGGGANHRFRLDDAILIKDNHIAAAGGIGPALSGARERVGHLVKVEIEVDSLAQLDEVLRQSEDVDAVVLDNFSPADLRSAVRTIGGRLVVEASGGITLANVAEIAATGVDVISVGALTHSVTALDIGLDFALET